MGRVYPSWPYQSKDCPGRPYHSSDQSYIGCSLCGTVVKRPDSQEKFVLTAAEYSIIIPCIAVANILRSTVEII